MRSAENQSQKPTTTVGTLNNHRDRFTPLASSEVQEETRSEAQEETRGAGSPSQAPLEALGLSILAADSVARYDHVLLL